MNYVQAKAAADAVVAAIAAQGGEAVAVQADVSALTEIPKLFDAAEARFGKPAIVVANAGVYLPKPIAQTTEEIYDRTFAITKGTFFLLQAAAGRVVDGGRIITISSGATVGWAPGRGPACAGSKAAVEQFTRALAVLGPRGIAVNAVLPGVTETDMTPASPGSGRAPWPARASAAWGRRADIADVIAFLAERGRPLDHRSAHRCARRRLLTHVRAAVLALAIALAGAQGALAATGPVDDPALIAAAKREGVVVFYSTFSQTDTNALAARFQARYGFPMQTLRADPVTMAARIATEQRAGRYEADVTTEPGFQTDELKHLGALEQYRAPENRDLLAGTFDPDGYWSTIFINSRVIGFNTDRLKALGLRRPASWQDLAAPGWRGNFTLYSGSYEWLQAMKRFYGRERALAIARSYAANQPHFVHSRTRKRFR